MAARVPAGTSLGGNNVVLVFYAILKIQGHFNRKYAWLLQPNSGYRDVLLECTEKWKSHLDRTWISILLGAGYTGRFLFTITSGYTETSIIRTRLLSVNRIVYLYTYMYDKISTISVYETEYCRCVYMYT